MVNRNLDKQCCVLVDVWGLTGSSEKTSHCVAPGKSWTLKKGWLDSIGKIAVYLTKPGTGPDDLPSTATLHYNPSGAYLPTRSFKVLVGAQGSVSVSETGD